jgi:gluconokinase
MIVVVMGVSGSGKSTVGRLLAKRLGWTFCEGDELHSAGNIEKMAMGISLTDEDRQPWLARIKKTIDTCSRTGCDAVVACSALRSRYRSFLTAGTTDIRFVYLKGGASLIRERMSSRESHYMKAGMLDSQLASLEEPDDAIVADIRRSPHDIVSHIARELGIETGQRQ